MDVKEAKAVVASVISTMYEMRDDLSGGVIPASQVYMLCGMDMHQYEVIAKILREGELAEVTSETIRLTQKGREIGRQLCEAENKKRSTSEPPSV